MILDGWGIGDKSKSDVISTIGAPNMERLTKDYASSQLLASGENVGLPDGQMGNSEVGHLNIGAGRVVYQDLVKINKAVEDGSIASNPAIVEAFTYAKENNKQVHFMGLLSDGGVHSLDNHLYKLCDVTKEFGLEKVFVHAFGDGRDTDPKSGKGFIQNLENHLETSNGKIASVIGRFYAMDRDNRWERVKQAYDLLVNATGEKATSAVEAMQASYDNNITDEFINPTVIVDDNGNPLTTIQKDDVVVFINYRNDRAKELTIALTQKDITEEGMKTIPLHYCTMTPYDSKFEGLNVIFDKENVANTMGEVVSAAGLNQLRIAETEKFAHVTFFFSGGRESEFGNESRVLVPSPKVATYDLQPEMSAIEVKDAVVDQIKTQKQDFIALNFANGDMVGHTGIYEAIEKAVKTVDLCVGEVVEAAQANDYTVMIIADHGNADYSVNADGSPNTAHSLNPVPCILIDNDIKEVKDGILADVAPTLLSIMGVDIPADMTGSILV